MSQMAILLEHQKMHIENVHSTTLRANVIKIFNESRTNTNKLGHM